MKYKKLLPKYQLGTVTPLASPEGYTNEELASINTESLTAAEPETPKSTFLDDFEGVDLNVPMQTTAIETTNIDTPIVDAVSNIFDQEVDRNLDPVAYFSKHGKFPTGQSIFLEAQATVSEEQIPYQQYIDNVIQEELPNGFKEHKTQCMYGGKNVIQCSAGTQWNFMDPTIENYISGAEKASLGIQGDGWTMGQNIIDSGGQRIYGLHGKGTRNLRKNMIERRKLQDLDLVMGNVMVGDVVEMFYLGSKYQAEANRMGTGDVHTTHVGQVTEDEDGDKFITHNIYGTWQTEPFEDVLKANGTGKGTDPRYFVSGIVRPGFTEASRNIRISDSPQQIKSATGIRSPQDMSPETVEAWQSVKGSYVNSSRGFLKGLEFYAPNVQKDFNISDEDMQNLILPSAFAIFGKESSFGALAGDYKKKVAKRQIIRSYKNTFKDFEHIPMWLLGKEAASEFEFDPYSEGPTQIKMESGSITKSWYASDEGKAYQKRYGINPETIYDPSIAAPATMLLIAKNIQLLKAGIGEGRWNTLDTLTKRNLIFKAHNKGIDAIFENEFIKDGKADIDGGIEIYRNLHLNRDSYTNLAQDFALALEIDYEGIKKDHTEAERIGYTAQIPKTAAEERAESRKEFGQEMQDFFKSSGSTSTSRRGSRSGGSSSRGSGSSRSSGVSTPTPNVSMPSRPSRPSGVSGMPSRDIDVSVPSVSMPERGPSPRAGVSAPNVNIPNTITSPISNIRVPSPDTSSPTAPIQIPEIDTTPLVSARGAEANRQLHEMFRTGTVGDAKIEMPASQDIDVVNSTPEEIRRAIAKSAKEISDTVDLSETFNLPEDSIPSIDRGEVKELLSGTELEGLGSQIAPNIADSLQVARRWADVNPEIAAQIPDEVMSELLLSEELIENGGTKTLEELAEEYLSGTIAPADSVLTPPPPIGDFEIVPPDTTGFGQTNFFTEEEKNIIRAGQSTQEDVPLPELRMGGHLPKYQNGIPSYYDTSEQLNKEMPWKKLNAFDKTDFFSRDEKIDMMNNPSTPRYISSGNPEIENKLSNVVAPGGVGSPGGAVNMYSLDKYENLGLGTPERKAAVAELNKRRDAMNARASRTFEKTKKSLPKEQRAYQNLIQTDLDIAFPPGSIPETPHSSTYRPSYNPYESLPKKQTGGSLPKYQNGTKKTKEQERGDYYLDLLERTGGAGGWKNLHQRPGFKMTLPDSTWYDVLNNRFNIANEQKIQGINDTLAYNANVRKLETLYSNPVIVDEKDPFAGFISSRMGNSTPTVPTIKEAHSIGAEIDAVKDNIYEGNVQNSHSENVPQYYIHTDMPFYRNPGSSVEHTPTSTFDLAKQAWKGGKSWGNNKVIWGNRYSQTKAPIMNPTLYELEVEASEPTSSSNTSNTSNTSNKKNKVIRNEKTGETWTQEEWDKLKGKGAFNKAEKKASSLKYGGELPKYQDGTEGTVVEANPENLTAEGEQILEPLYSKPEVVIEGKRPNTLKGQVGKFLQNPNPFVSPAVARYAGDYQIHSQNPDLVKTYDRRGFDALPLATIKRKLGNFDPSKILYKNRQAAAVERGTRNNIYRASNEKNNPFTLDISGQNLAYARAGEQVEGTAILGGDFLEDEPTALLASEYRKPGAQRFEGQGKKIDINPEEQEYYGVVNNELKVGKINDFSDKDVIVPIRWGGDYDLYEEGEEPESVTTKQSTPGGHRNYGIHSNPNQGSTRKVTTQPMLTSDGKPAYTNSASGKMILYSPSSGQKRFLFGYDKDGMREESQKFKRKYKDARYITLDTGRFNMIASNKKGLTEKDFIDYSSGGFENEIGSGYNIIYNPK